MAYEPFPIETEPANLAEDAFTWLQDRWPGWLPSPANFDAGTIEAHARMVAELRDLAASVPDDIFMRFGATLAGIPPLDATSATVAATVTAIDNLGYTLPAGTAFGSRSTGDDLRIFLTDADVTIPPFSTVSAVGEVTLTALEPGAAYNQLAGVSSVLMGVDVVPWVESLIATGATAGGQDAESIIDYLDRLTEELRLSSPRPILPADFAVLAKRDAAVERAVAYDLVQAGTNERQTVSHNATGGTLPLTWSGQTTTQIDWNATAAAIQFALEALSNINPGDVEVTGGPWPAAVSIEYKGRLGETDQPAVTSSNAVLTPAASTITITTTQAGAVGAVGIARCVTVGVVDENGEDPGSATRTRVRDMLASMREATFLTYVIPPAYNVVGVTFTGKCLPGWIAADVEVQAESAVTQYLSPANFGMPAIGQQTDWIADDRIRVTEIVEVLNRVDGFWYVDTGSVLINGVNADLILTGRAPLPRPGVINGTVTQG